MYGKCAESRFIVAASMLAMIAAKKPANAKTASIEASWPLLRMWAPGGGNVTKYVKIAATSKATPMNKRRRLRAYKNST